MASRASLRNEIEAALRDERADLLELIGSLSDDQWLARTPAPDWSVRDVTLHLLDDDLVWLSIGRDGDLSGLIPMNVEYRAFVRALDGRNQRWVDTASFFSRRVIHDLLTWTGEQVAEYHASLRPGRRAGVIWAGEDPPWWLGLGRDFTERWVHQQQIREAVNRPDRHDRYLPLVLSVFVWAFPHQYRPFAPPGTTVELDLGSSDRWHLRRGDDRWRLYEGRAECPAARLVADLDSAWRLLTGAEVTEGMVETAGPADLTRPLLEVRSIIV